MLHESDDQRVEWEGFQKHVQTSKQDVLEKIEKVNSIIIQKGLNLDLYHEQESLKE